jgi:hypothetical protein
MKKLLNKYYFYNLICKDSNVKFIYVGSTHNLSARKMSHKKRCCDSSDEYYNLNVYKTIRQHGGWENWTFTIIDTLDNLTEDQSKEKEQEFIDKLQEEYKLNMRNAFRTEEVKHQQKKKSWEKWNSKEETKAYKKEWARLKKEKLNLVEIEV